MHLILFGIPSQFGPPIVAEPKDRKRRQHSTSSQYLEIDYSDRFPGGFNEVGTVAIDGITADVVAGQNLTLGDSSQHPDRRLGFCPEGNLAVTSHFSLFCRRRSKTIFPE